MKLHGQFLGIPYDWRLPTIAKIRHRIWNNRTHHIFVPKTFGWGYTINWHALLTRLKLID